MRKLNGVTLGGERALIGHYVDETQAKLNAKRKQRGTKPPATCTNCHSNLLKAYVLTYGTVCGVCKLEKL